MNTRIFALAMALFLAVPMMANAEGECNRPDAVAIEGYYVDDRPGDGTPWGSGLLTGGGTWVYEESNGMPGLQVGGEGETEEYAGCENPDTLIF